MAGKKISKTLLSFFLVLAGCANIYTARGVYHRLQPGETLAAVASRYGASLQEVAETNDVEDASQVKAGKSIFIPRARVGHFAAHRRQGKSSKSSKGKVAARHHTVRRKAGVIEVDHNRFAWPVVGEISSLYGVRRGRRHDGVDVRSPRGTSIHAAADGEVVYSKRLRGYGNLILLKHSKNFFTVYAHNSVNLVKKGTRIREGQVIAKVGSTGRATGPHVHFEVREGTKPRNPLFFLPKNRYAAKARVEGPFAAQGGE